MSPYYPSKFAISKHILLHYSLKLVLLRWCIIVAITLWSLSSKWPDNHRHKHSRSYQTFRIARLE